MDILENNNVVITLDDKTESLISSDTDIIYKCKKCSTNFKKASLEFFRGVMRVVVGFADGAHLNGKLAQFIKLGARRGARHKDRCRGNAQGARQSEDDHGSLGACTASLRLESEPCHRIWTPCHRRSGWPG